MRDDPAQEARLVNKCLMDTELVAACACAVYDDFAQSGRAGGGERGPCEVHVRGLEVCQRGGSVDMGILTTWSRWSCSIERSGTATLLLLRVFPMMDSDRLSRDCYDILMASSVRYKDMFLPKDRWCMQQSVKDNSIVWTITLVVALFFVRSATLTARYICL